MDFEAVRRYWEDRASSDGTAQSTTNDIYLRDIEFSVVNEATTAIKPRRVLDVGCGDARTTTRLAAAHLDRSFTGIDYSESMVLNANSVLKQFGLTNLAVHAGDVTKALDEREIDLIYTTRCLINVPSWELQKVALTNIGDALAPDGHFLMIENFIEGHRLFNDMRRQFDLPEIPVRSHNCFFERDRMMAEMQQGFLVVREQNISSAYYLMSRVIYSRICKDTGKEPDYFDANHKYAAGLPFLGEYGPVRAILFKKRNA